MRLRLAAASVAALFVVACGTYAGGGVPVVSPPVQALAAWDGFPAGKIPRPIVLFWDLHPSGNAYVNGDAKLAAVCNKFALSVQLPAEVPSRAVATWADGTSASYPAISASDAFSAMLQKPSGAGSPDCASVPALPVTSASFATASFATDRGMAQMSAWRFSSPGAVGQMDYPAISPAAFWKDGTINRSSDSATVGADGLTITFAFIGASVDGPCGASYKGLTAESDTAVAVAVQDTPNSTGPGNCTTEGYFRTVMVPLQTKLGGRVVIDAAGLAVSVCPVAAQRKC
jgi:hypothetical protein